MSFGTVAHVKGHSMWLSISWYEFIHSYDWEPERHYPTYVPKLPMALVTFWFSADNIVSWEPEGRYCRSKMFHWEPEGRYWHWLCTSIAPFWFSMDHLWVAVMPFWLSTDDIVYSYLQELLKPVHRSYRSTKCNIIHFCMSLLEMNVISHYLISCSLAKVLQSQHLWR